MSHETAVPQQKAVLVGITLPEGSDAETVESLAELRRLVSTLGYETVGTIAQRRPSLAGGTVLGEGKLKELAGWTGGKGVVERPARAKKSKAAMKFNPTEEDEEEFEYVEEDEEGEFRERADVVIFDCELSPSQLMNLQRASGAEVLDRTGVIVEIFSRHAKTREAKLQVEIARLKYLAPRVRVTGSGPADRSGRAGETSLELDKRKIRDRISELKDEIAAVQKEQSGSRSLRALQNCVALVGYTNAGKSSLMRALTGSEVLVADKLFATLDTTVRTLAPPTVPPILVSDTVGFIQKLPHDLVASFRSTLEEAKNAGLLLFTVDASDVSFRSQLAVTREVLSSIGVEDIPSRLILNKCDKLNAEELAALTREFPDAIQLSAKNPADVASLRERLIEFFEGGMVEQEVFVPYSKQKAIGALRNQVRVLGERHTDEGTFVMVRADSNNLGQLRTTLGI